MKWNELTTIEQWEQALASSENKPVVVLKHSTACPVSFSAYDEFEAYLAKEDAADADYYLVKVIESRPVSNKIAEDLNLKHASPQIMLIKNKEQQWNTSHWSVTTKHMTAVLN